MNRNAIIALIIVLIIATTLTVAFIYYINEENKIAKDEDIKIYKEPKKVEDKKQVIVAVPEYEKVMKKYLNAMENKDFQTINELSVNKVENTDIEKNENIWNSMEIEIKETRIHSKTDTNVVYSVYIQVNEIGLGAFAKGLNQRWLCLQKVENGEWMISSLATSL